jgi:hypothetical protein
LSPPAAIALYDGAVLDGVKGSLASLGGFAALDAACAPHDVSR